MYQEKAVARLRVAVKYVWDCLYKYDITGRWQQQYSLSGFPAHEPHPKDHVAKFIDFREDVFEIIWSEQVSFEMDLHESFFLRDGEELYLSKWYEEGNGLDEMVSERNTKVNIFKFYMSWR